MRKLFHTIDQLLRGAFTRPDDLRQGRVIIKVRTLLIMGFFLGTVYGAFMGLYGVLRPGAPSVQQLLATTAKVPLLFIFTLVVTFPSLYVFSTLAGSRLRFLETMRLLLVGIAINLALLASFGPVTGFFTLCTDSYPFMVVLNVIFFSVSGTAGLVFMYKALKIVVEAKATIEANESEKQGSNDPGVGEPQTDGKPPALPRQGILGTQRVAEAARAKTIFFAWAIIYGAVGAQMGWIMRPFVGAPDLPFELFRVRESNFFEAFLHSLRLLLE